MTQPHHRSARPVVKDNVVFNARRTSGKPKSNATSFKKGRKKTGGRKAGTPNKTTGFFREAVLTAAENAGNKVGGDGLVELFEVGCTQTSVKLFKSAWPLDAAAA